MSQACTHCSCNFSSREKISSHSSSSLTATRNAPAEEAGDDYVHVDHSMGGTPLLLAAERGLWWRRPLPLPPSPWTGSAPSRVTRGMSSPPTRHLLRRTAAWRRMTTSSRSRADCAWTWMRGKSCSGRGRGCAPSSALLTGYRVYICQRRRHSRRTASGPMLASCSLWGSSCSSSRGNARAFVASRLGSSWSVAIDL